MVKAVLRNGVIQPLDPLPDDWKEGEELSVVSHQEQASLRQDLLDRHLQTLDELCAQGDSDDDDRLMSAIEASRQQAKEVMRRRIEQRE